MPPLITYSNLSLTDTIEGSFNKFLLDISELNGSDLNPK
jgi:hypothetical protein